MSRHGRTTKRNAPSPRSEAKIDAGALNSWLAGEWPRRVLLAIAAALLVATPIIPAELGVMTGEALLVPVLWLAVGVAWLLHLTLRRDVQIRFGPVDALVAAFVAWYALTAIAASYFEAPRPAFNMMWYVVGAGASFFALRQLPRTSLQRRALVVVMLSMTAAMSAHAFYQYFHEIRHTQREYEADPEGVLARAGFGQGVDERQRMQFEGRLYSLEPTSTFALTNSLAGLLAPWLIVGTAVAVIGFPKKDAAPLDRRARLARIALAVILVAVAFCLVLTKSRSAYVATAVGIIGLGVLWARSMATGEDARRRLSKIVMAGVGIVALVAMIALVALWLGGLDKEVVSEASKSLGYRMQYWRSTSSMIADHPVLGVGPGNFRYFYTQYKLPEASEEIADPHNFLFEIASNTGLPGALLFVAILTAAAYITLRRPSEDNASESSESNVYTTRLILFGGAGGYFLAVPIGLPLPPFVGIVIGLTVYAFVATLLSGWVDHGRLPKGTALLAVTVLLVNLLAAGGVTVPGVSVSMWMLLAVAIGEREEDSATLRRPPSWCTASVLALLIALTLAAYWSMYVVTTSRAKVFVAENDLRDGPEAATAAVAIDPLSPDATRLVMEYAYVAWARRPSDESWERVLAAREAAIAVCPRGAPLYRRSADMAMSAWQATKQPRFANEAVEDLARAAELYPNEPSLQADLATAYFAVGDEDASRSHAAKALELDAITPHDDKKLDAIRRARCDAIAGAVESP